MTLKILHNFPRVGKCRIEQYLPEYLPDSFDIGCIILICLFGTPVYFVRFEIKKRPLWTLS